MRFMGKLGRLGLPVVSFALAGMLGCSRQQAIVPPASADHALPFATASDTSRPSPTEAIASPEIPAGTTIILRLQQPLSSADCHIGDVFTASLEDPVVIQDHTLAPKGSAVTGTVISAKPSGLDSPGYLRLTLSTVTLDGKKIHLHSSSVFGKGNVPHASRGTSGHDAKFSTAQRLSFHLIDPVILQQ